MCKSTFVLQVGAKVLLFWTPIMSKQSTYGTFLRDTSYIKTCKINKNSIRKENIQNLYCFILKTKFERKSNSMENVIMIKREHLFQFNT